MWLILVILFILLLLGLIQKIRHQKNLDAIPIIIHVNGTRGKSTVTRLITGMLKEAGVWVIGKTAGASEYMIHWDSDWERDVQRKRKESLIPEQIKLVREAAREEADALVCECPALGPDEQKLFQTRLLQGNIGVITNVFADHLDVMGPTLDQVAEALSYTIPYEGFLVIMDGPYADYFTEIAEMRDTEVILVDPDEISDDVLDLFDYVVFPENVALALGVAIILEIDEETALRGMINSLSDPAAARMIPIGTEENSSYFLNGFAASDATSILNLLDEVEYLGYPIENPVVIINCHPCRVDVTKQLVREVLPELSVSTLVVIGQGTSLVCEAYEDELFTADELYDCENIDSDQVLEILGENVSDRVIIGMGIYNEVAEELVHYIEDYQMTQRVS